MSLVERFSLALQSHLGPLLAGLFLILSLLGAFYWLLVARQRKHDLLAYHFRAHYERALELSKELIFQDTHKADFFGRQTIVRLPQGEHGLCLIPPPDLNNAEVCDRFRCFWRATHFHQLPLFSQYSWKHDERLLVLVQNQLINRKGKRFLTLKHFLTDQRLLHVDREEILLEVARALARLHDLHAEFGGHIYHGFLLPRSIVIDLDSGNRVRHLAIADAGLAFALGPQRVCNRLEKLRQAKLPLERYCSHEILEQMAHLAPEQKKPNRLHDVGPSADFFAFGALAASLFTHQRFTTRNAIKWELIPEKWRPFVEACLSESPQDRPQDFLELEDWLTDPELALTHQSSQPPHNKAPTIVKSELGPLSEMLQRIQETQMHTTADLGELLQSAENAITASRWRPAKKHLDKALLLDPNHALTHVKLAIVCLELGDQKTAERHYFLAKQINPKIAKQFREYLAFKM